MATSGNSDVYEKRCHGFLKRNILCARVPAVKINLTCRVNWWEILQIIKY